MAHKTVGLPHVVLRLARALADHVDRHEVGVVFVSPADISWSPDTHVHPDVFVADPEEARTQDWRNVKTLLLRKPSRCGLRSSIPDNRTRTRRVETRKSGQRTVPLQRPMAYPSLHPFTNRRSVLQPQSHRRSIQRSMSWARIPETIRTHGLFPAEDSSRTLRRPGRGE
jgi:hypothetical protein